MAGKASANVSTPLPGDLDEVALETLRTASTLKASQLRKALPKSHQAFAQDTLVRLRALAESARVHRRAYGKTEIFFSAEPIGELDRALDVRGWTESLDEGAITALIQSRAPGHERLLKEWLQSAIACGHLYVHAPAAGSRKKTYGNEPDVGGILKGTLQALRKALPSADAARVPRERIAAMLLKELGVNQKPHAQPAAPVRHNGNGSPAPPRAELFLAALRGLQADNPGQALLSVRDLRARLKLDKAEFDEVALGLAQQGSISLHHHDHPAGLTDGEREALVRDARGNHYIGIALRRAL